MKRPPVLGCEKSYDKQGTSVRIEKGSKIDSLKGTELFKMPG